MSKTIKKSITFEGTGLHSGRAGRVSLFPSEKKGIFFKTSAGLIPLTSAVVEEDKRLTGFRLADGTPVRTAEHLLASLAGMGIDSAVLELEGSEVPILDGSSYPFASAIADAGTEETGRKKSECAIMVPVVLEDAARGRIIAAIPSDKLRITYIIDYSGTPIGTQRVHYDINPENFLETISKARTFGLTSELDYLKQAGLAKGGSLDNALIFDESSLLNEGGLRFPLECATHKVIDLLGDLMLVGDIPIAHYTAICAGHDIHGRLADKLKRLFPAEQG